MDMNLFRKALARQQNILQEGATVLDKTDKAGHNGADAYIIFRYEAAEDRSIWLPTKSDIAHYGKSALKKVKRWYHNEDPNNGINGGSGLVYVDIKSGLIKFLDGTKDNDKKLNWHHARFTLERIALFSKKVLENQ